MNYRTLYRSNAYRSRRYNLILYPDRETAVQASNIPLLKTLSNARVGVEDKPVVWAEFWSRRLEKPIDFCKRGDYFIALQTADKYVPVLTENKIRWVISEKWLSLKEIPLSKQPF
jgi:hypothetical protein